MGIRVAPDGYDIIVWKFDETASPFENSSITGTYTAVNSRLSLITGIINCQQPSPFAPFGTNSSLRFFGNWNNGSLSYNSVRGAVTVEPQPPVTFSGWYFVRSNNASAADNTPLFQKMNTLNIGAWDGGGANRIEFLNFISGSSTFFISPVAGSASVTATQVLSFPIGTWFHMGMTYDGTLLKAYINGNLIGSATNGSGPSNINYGSHGQWSFGSDPSGSSNPREPAMSVCDFRIANTIRPQSYFQNIYRLGATTSGFGKPFQTYYKLRAYDLSCTTPTAVYWTSATIDYTLAPTAPCGSLGPIEIMETWSVLG
jgi:hypothetical protein